MGGGCAERVDSSYLPASTFAFELSSTGTPDLAIVARGHRLDPRRCIYNSAFPIAFSTAARAVVLQFELRDWPADTVEAAVAANEVFVSRLKAIRDAAHGMN